MLTSSHGLNRALTMPTAAGAGEGAANMEAAPAGDGRGCGRDAGTAAPRRRREVAGAGAARPTVGAGSALRKRQNSVSGNGFARAAAPQHEGDDRRSDRDRAQQPRPKRRDLAPAPASVRPVARAAGSRRTSQTGPEPEQVAGAARSVGAKLGERPAVGICLGRPRASRRRACCARAFTIAPRQVLALSRRGSCRACETGVRRRRRRRRRSLGRPSRQSRRG